MVFSVVFNQKCKQCGKYVIKKKRKKKKKKKKSDVYATSENR